MLCSSAPTDTIQKLQRVRTMQLGLSFRLRGDVMPSRYCISWTAALRITCKLAVLTYNASIHRISFTVKLQNMPQADLCAHPPSRCWQNRSPGQTFLDVLSDFQRLQSGIRCREQFSLSLSLSSSNAQNLTSEYCRAVLMIDSLSVFIFSFSTLKTYSSSLTFFSN